MSPQKGVIHLSSDDDVISRHDDVTDDNDENVENDDKRKLVSPTNWSHDINLFIHQRLVQYRVLGLTLGIIHPVIPKCVKLH